MSKGIKLALALLAIAVLAGAIVAQPAAGETLYSLLRYVKTTADTIKSTSDTIKATTDAISNSIGTGFRTFVNDWFTAIDQRIKGNETTYWSPIKTMTETIKGYLENANYGLQALKSSLDTISDRIGTPPTSGDTLFGLLNTIRITTNTINTRTTYVTQFTAGTYSTTAPTSDNPVNLGKPAKVTLTVRVTDDATPGFNITVYIHDEASPRNWQTLRFEIPGGGGADMSGTVEFTTGTDGIFYFTVEGTTTFTAYIYSAETAP